MFGDVGWLVLGVVLALLGFAHLAFSRYGAVETSRA